MSALNYVVKIQRLQSLHTQKMNNQRKVNY